MGEAARNKSARVHQIQKRLLKYLSTGSYVGWGDNDHFFSVDQCRRTVDLVNGAFSLYKGAGHFTPEECVDEIVEDLLDLIK
jgi:pimeloyl-ACP methyl ester carboxylesterase